MGRNDVATEEKRETPYDETSITIENMGGIDACSVTFPQGVSILTGRNATNRTSLLTALADVMGGSPATLKSDADHGRIELELGDQTYSREYARRNGGLVSEGTQYTDSRDLVDLFVRLLEDNPARRSVERGENLRDLIMRPVDTDEIQREIQERRRERTDVDDRLEAIGRERDRLPELEKRRTDLDERRAEIEGEIDEVRTTIDEYEASEEEAEQAESLRDELDELRRELADVEDQIAHQETQLEGLRADRDELEADLTEMDVPAGEAEPAEDELERRRRQEREIQHAIDDLTSVIQFNDEIVGDEEIGLPDVEVDQEVTANLDPQSMVVECWTCGSRVERGDIADRLDGLRDVLADYRERRERLKGEIDELEAERREYEKAVRRREELERRLEDVDEEIDIREEKIVALEDEREDVQSELDAMDERVEETSELRENDLVESYRHLSELEYERGQLDNELDDVEEEIGRIEGLGDEREQLEAQRAALAEEIESLQSRIETLEREAVDQFNGRMEEILELLAYQNVARVWIERKPGAGRGSDGTVFELHIVRETEADSVYEDVVDNLSESEREVIGLIVALAGYIVHEVYDEIPMMLLDSLESIDSERIAALVEYFAEYTSFLIVALLPEDADALPDEYERITATELAA